jgi:hypothetical protein
MSIMRTLRMLRKLPMMKDPIIPKLWIIPIHFSKLQLNPICKKISLQKIQENSNVHMIVIFHHFPLRNIWNIFKQCIYTKTWIQKQYAHQIVVPLPPLVATKNISVKNLKINILLMHPQHEFEFFLYEWENQMKLYQYLP